MKGNSWCVGCGKEISKGSLRCSKCYGKYRIGKPHLSETGKKSLSDKMKENNPNRGKIGKRIIERLGYVYLYVPNHPCSTKTGYYPEHRIIVEKFIGRFLKKEEVVHHIDGNKKNNVIENLMLFKNSGYHLSFHIKIKQFGMTNPVRRQIEERWEEFKK